ncbi:MAG TPA: serine/threonine-protein kinase, partial [Syntrophales bacterium]
MSEIVAHYRILRKIGSGGMGDVYLAEDARLHRQVALKMLRPESEADPHQLQRFLREALAASSLTHPNIAVIYETGETEKNTRFIAMEYVAGESLDRKLTQGPLPTDAIIELGLEIADALDEAHSKGIV